ncbi:outer membrane receptor protein involved in Fe transport [Lacibacter cauensis]|uniref:Outer membrane receptor protein involved in Fe transport n=1 Tax=Lacibacter cauensis TaxID=510947 RepID=A0A562SV61_9BACT|nr:outer membrane beta-barrel family protein [Lacibacter cauensis]TWI85207.1 outer membrane receptor protein involved in Fe transport [Lacibacter cauensis]
MKKLLALTAAVLTFTYSGFAQSSSRLKGEVKDESQKPFSGITVSLLRSKDSSLVKAAITDKSGGYLFEAVKNGSYLLGVTAVGYQKMYSNVVDVKEGAELSVPAFSLTPQAKGLQEVTVTARKPLFEQKPDKMLVNVEASPSNAGANALEILEKSPGVSVDKDGNISLKGKAGVQVFIDGKPAYLSGADLANYLRNLQGTQLDQIEIMTNPPAKYDAAGNSGIINIKTKKTKQMGYNILATAGYSQGVYASNNQNINFNYRKNKVNLFGTVSRNERNSFQLLSIQRKFIEQSSKEVKSLFEQESLMRNLNIGNNGKVGADVYLSKKTTIGATVNGFYNLGMFTNNSDIDIAAPDGTLMNKANGYSKSRSNWRHFGSNINFRHQFDSTGKELTADVDYLHYNAANTQNLMNRYFDATGTPTITPDNLLGNLPQLISIYSAKTDYLHPLKKGAKFEAGLKTSFVRTDNNAVYDTLRNGSMILDSARSNHFVYTENINAAYVNYSKEFSKKFSVQVGLRLENTTAKGNSKGLAYSNTYNKFMRFDSTFTLNYTQLFPTVFLQYTVNEKNSFTANYGRRIRRPDYENLNPFVEFLDRYTYEQGNPNLRPQFSHNIELSHTFNNFLTTTLNYTKTNNIIQQVLEQNEANNESYIKQANIANQRQFGIAVSAFKQFKGFSGNIYANVFNNEFNGIVNNTQVTMGATTAMFNGSLAYKFKKGLTTEVSGFYRTAGVDGVFRIGGFGMMNLGASVPVFKTKGTIRLNVRDVLWSQRIKGESKFGNIDAQFQNYRDSRVATITFTYRIAKGKVNGNTRRKSSAAADEQNRVKGSE